MVYSVVGDWNGFVFKLIETEDIPKVYEHLKTEFMRDETTSKLTGFTEEYAQDFIKVYDWIFSLNEGLSFIAVDKETGNVAGVRITYKQTKDTDFSQFNFESEAMKKLFSVIEMVDKEAKVFDHYGIDYYAMFITASIAKAYRNRGLATEMYRRSIDLLRSQNFPMCKSVFTSPYSQKIAKNFNFEQLSIVHYKGLKDSNGKIMFPEAKEEDCASLMCLKL